MTVIKHGTVLVDGKLVKTDIAFDQHEILAIGPDLEGDDIIDASGLTVLPAFVDVHVHLRQPGHEEKETIETGTKAAAKGGFATIFAMPNVIPYPSDVETILPYKKQLDTAAIRALPFATITKNEAGKEPVDYAAIKEIGIPWFSDDGVGVADKHVMKQCMDKAKEAGVLFSCHTENMDYRKPGASVHESEYAKEHGWLGIPSACETSQLVRDLDLLPDGLAYHACHISAKESVQALKEAKEAGKNVTGEVTAHHLLLEDTDVQGPNWKMNPPLRSHEDRMALIQGLEEGSLDMIANDHAPHTEEEKNRPMDKAPFGIVSLETAFPLLYTHFVKTGRWSLPQLVNWMSTAPAKRFGLEKTGQIKTGWRPDFVLIDENEPDIIRKDTFISKGKNTPFEGWETACTIKQTISGGKTVWKG
jgi:dihydroorotase